MDRKLKPQMYIIGLLLVNEKSLVEISCSFPVKGVTACNNHGKETLSMCQAPCVKRSGHDGPVGGYTTVNVYFEFELELKLEYFFTKCFDEFGIKYWKVASGPDMWRYVKLDMKMTGIKKGAMILIKDHTNTSFQVWGRQKEGNAYSRKNNFYSFITTTSPHELTVKHSHGYCPPTPAMAAVDGDGRCTSSAYPNQIKRDMTIVGLVSCLISKLFI